MSDQYLQVADAIANAEFRGDLGVVVQLIAGQKIIELAAWSGLETELARVVQEARNTGTTVLSMGPDRYWLINSHGTADERFANNDLSAGLSCFRIMGAQARNVLRKGLPIDLHAVAFPSGSSATSAIDDIVVTVHDTGDGFDIYCSRSFARSLWEWLLDASLEFK